MRPNSLNALVAVAATASVAAAAGLKDIKHIVLFMQENRAFDHYFGTMAGVRGFMDPNVQVNPNGKTVFQQPVLASQSKEAETLKPWYLNYMGGDWVNRTQCSSAGSNSWQAMHSAYNGGLNNRWVEDNDPHSWAYYKRSDLPVHWDIAEGWTVLDMNQESILAATDPNRIHWMSGTVNAPGTPSNPKGEGSIIIDNNATPGCEAPHLNCYPFVWKTFPEYLEEAGVTWQVYQDFDNFEDNMLAYFQQYQNAPNGSALRDKGNSYPGLQKFYDDARDGTLPQVSYIIGPAELAEHPPYMPKDGAWLQRKVVESVTKGAAYENTALFITYDEEGGWGDHVVPFVPPNGTAGEWIVDPYGSDEVPVGPGFRIPSYIISPWTRGGQVFTEHSDHSSQIMFVEEWAAANGFEGVHSKELTQWRRNHMSNLVNVFDFNNPDVSLPKIAAAETPLTETASPSDYSGNLTIGSLTGNWIGAAKCLSDYSTVQATVPYGKDNEDQELSLLVEEGFKQVRGRLTEGRYLTFETQGLALANTGAATVAATAASSAHSDVQQRWVLHAQDYDSDVFTLSSALDGRYIGADGKLVKNAANAQSFTITYTADGATYSIDIGTQDHPISLTAGKHGQAGTVSFGTGRAAKFEIFSVSYH